MKNNDPTPKMVAALFVVGLITLVATGVIDPHKILTASKELYSAAQGFLFPTNFNL